MSAYWVKWQSDLKGPYGLDGISTLIDRGVVAADTPLQPTGQNRWIRAGDIPEVAEILREHLPPTVVMASSPYTPAPAPPVPASPAPAADRAPKRRGLVRLAVGAGIGLLLGGAILGGTLWWTTRDGPPYPEPLLAEGLPSQVRTLVAIRIREGEGDDEQRGRHISMLAPLCGGIDLATSLLGAVGRSPDELLNDGTLGALQRENLREQLQCAERLLSGMQRPEMFVMEFEDGTRTRPVILLPLGDVEHAPFPLSYNFSGLQGRCHPDATTAGQCAASEPAWVRNGDLWAFGEAEHVAPYAREWNRGAERSVSTNMEYARLLAEQIDSNAVVSGVYVRPEVLPFGDMCSSVPGGVLACLPAEVQDTLTRIRTNVRGVSVDIRTPGTATLTPTVRWAMSYGARDEADAEDVSRDLDELVRDWRAHLENREPSFIETIRTEATENMDEREALLRAFIRAMRSAEIEVDGRVARLVAEDELREAELREVRSQLERQRTRRVAASRVVLAVLGGETPDTADLGALVGEAAAGWMLQPRATRAQCDTIRARIASFSGPNMATTDFGAVFRLRERFAEGSCAGTVMPAATAQCLTEAASATAMETCPRAIPPWQAQGFHQTYRGELTDADSRVPDDNSPYDSYQVSVAEGHTLVASLSSDAFDTYLWLIGPDGTSLVQDDDGGEGTNSAIRYAAPVGGTYTLRANAYDGVGRGPYVLDVRVE